MKPRHAFVIAIVGLLVACGSEPVPSAGAEGGTIIRHWSENGREIWSLLAFGIEPAGDKYDQITFQRATMRGRSPSGTIFCSAPEGSYRRHGETMEAQLVGPVHFVGLSDGNPFVGSAAESIYREHDQTILIDDYRILTHHGLNNEGSTGRIHLAPEARRFIEFGADYRGSSLTISDGVIAAVRALPAVDDFPPFSTR